MSISRILAAALLFLVKAGLAALLVALDLGIERLAGLVLEPDGSAHKIVELVLDICFVGAATAIAGAGAIVIAAEVVVSSYRYIRQWTIK